MVFTNKYTQILINKFSKFAESNTLAETIKLYSDGKQVSASTVFTGLTNYIVDELIKKHIDITQEELKIYKFIEQTRTRYSGFPEDSDEFDFDNAACVCFLENLQNIASIGEIEYSRFIPYLGEKSKEFCRAWDKFTGAKSEGLWNEG